VRRAPASELLLVVLLALVGGGAPAADAQSSRDVRLVVTAMTGVVGAGVPGAADGVDPPEDVTFRLLVENRGDTDLDGLRIVVESWGRVDTRSEMRQALDGGEVTAEANSPLDLQLLDGGALIAGGVAGVEVTLDADRLGFDGSDATAHPVQISLVRGTQLLDQVRTAVVNLPEVPTAPLETVLVWPLDDAPWRGPDGTYEPEVDAATRPGGRLDELVRAVEQHPEVSVTLAPAAHLLEDLRDRADGYRLAADAADDRPDPSAPPDPALLVTPDDPTAIAANAFLRRLRDVATASSIAPVAGPYADVSLAGLADGRDPLVALAGSAASDGRRRLQDLLDRRPDPGTFLATSPIDAAALDLVGADHLLVGYEQVRGPDLDASPTVDIPYALRRTTAPSGRPLFLTVGDPWMTRLLATLDTQHGPVVAAHRIVVETAMLQLRRPGVAGRPLLVLPPIGWDPPGRTAEEILTQLDAAPWIRLTDPAALLSRADRAPIAVQLAEPAAVLSDTLADALVAAEEALDAAVAALPDDGAEIQGRPRVELEEQLLRAPSAWYLGPGDDRAEALVRDVSETVDRAFGVVDVPDSARVTLTSERGTIPVTLRRQGGPVTVKVTVDSQGGLAWPDGRTSPEVTLTEDGTQTVSFATRALSRGTFVVTVTVTDPTGERVLERTRLSVRSTAISGPALGVTGLIVALLLLRGLLRRQPAEKPDLRVVR